MKPRGAGALDVDRIVVEEQDAIAWTIEKLRRPVEDCAVVAGRLSWRWVANSTPLLYVAPFAAVAVIVVIPAALTLANVLAAVPARRAARLRPGDVLRTE